MSSLPCGHIFHQSCIRKCVSVIKKCPNCRIAAEDYQVQNLFLNVVVHRVDETERIKFLRGLEGPADKINLEVMHKNEKLSEENENLRQENKKVLKYSNEVKKDNETLKKVHTKLREMIKEASEDKKQMEKSALLVDQQNAELYETNATLTRENNILKKKNRKQKNYMNQFLSKEDTKSLSISNLYKNESVPDKDKIDNFYSAALKLNKLNNNYQSSMNDKMKIIQDLNSKNEKSEIQLTNITERASNYEKLYKQSQKLIEKQKERIKKLKKHILEIDGLDDNIEATLLQTKGFEDSKSQIVSKVHGNNGAGFKNGFQFSGIVARKKFNIKNSKGGGNSISQGNLPLGNNRGGSQGLNNGLMDALNKKFDKDKDCKGLGIIGRVNIGKNSLPIQNRQGMKQKRLFEF